MPIEESFCSGKPLPTDAGATPGIEIHRNLYREWNARRAEAMALRANSQIDALIQARAFIFRGRHQQARAILESGIRMAKAPDTRADLLMDHARLANCEGNWNAAIATVDEALRLSPSAITLLSLHQVRSVALFESGRIREATEAVEILESLAHVFPNGCTPLYSRVLGIRLLARARPIAVASLRLQSIWSELIENKLLDPDRTLTLLRTEIDLRRLEGKPHYPIAEATYRLADLMGDRLYTGLALTDCIATASNSTAMTLPEEVTSAAAEFSRVREALSAIDDDRVPLSTTLQTLRAFYLKGVRSSAEPAFQRPISHIVLPGDALLQLNPWRVTRLLPNTQLRAALEVLRSNSTEITKQDFFQRIWGRSKYTVRLHDSVIHALLHRLRKEAGLNVTVEASAIRLEGTLFL